MWFTQESQDFRAWFPVVQAGGTLEAGLLSGAFVATIVAPDDSASLTPTVTESTQRPGLYTFVIPSVFLTTHGIGQYGIVVEVTASSNQVLAWVLTVTQDGFDSLGNLGKAILGNVI